MAKLHGETAAGGNVPVRVSARGDVSIEFIPSGYVADATVTSTHTTTNGGTLAASVRRVRVYNRASANGLRVGFGASTAAALANVTIGPIVPAGVVEIFGVPYGATVYNLLGVGGSATTNLTQGF